ncbi:MAG: LDL receptor domain-containing protein [Pseudomonadota bacterium]
MELRVGAFLLVLSFLFPACEGSKNFGYPPSLIPCQDGHYKCGNGKCIPGAGVNDGDDDCGDGSDEFAPPPVEDVPYNTDDVPYDADQWGADLREGCAPDEFSCENGSCIPNSWVGNGTNDCGDGSDEVPDCQEICSEYECGTVEGCSCGSCPGGQLCVDGTCVYLAGLCVSCANGAVCDSGLTCFIIGSLDSGVELCLPSDTSEGDSVCLYCPDLSVCDDFCEYDSDCSGSCTSWDSCEYSSTCDESGAQYRSCPACTDNHCEFESESKTCTRDTDGDGCGSGKECQNGSCVAAIDCDLYNYDGSVDSCSACTDTGNCDSVNGKTFCGCSDDGDCPCGTYCGCALGFACGECTY